MRACEKLRAVLFLHLSLFFLSSGYSRWSMSNLFVLAMISAAILATGLRHGGRMRQRISTQGHLVRAQVRAFSGGSALRMCADTGASGLADRISAQGNVVRDLKAAKAAKEEVKVAVDALLILKAELAVLSGPTEASPALPSAEKQGKAMTPKEQRIAAKNSQANKKGGGGKKEEGGQSQTLEEIRANRLMKLEAMRAQGINPFEYTFGSSHKATELHAQFADKLNVCT